MTWIKLKYCLLILIISQSFFAQNKVIEKFISLEIDKSAHYFKYNKNFHKAYLSFISKNYDSTLIYSMKHLYSNSNNKSLKDYCHYFRGYSFKHKKLYIQAIKEFQLISKNNNYYNEIINLNSGEIAIEQNDFKKGLDCFLELDKINLKYVLLSYVDGNIGICYIHLKDFNKSKTFLFKSLGEFTLEKDTTSLIRAYTNIANMYYEQYNDNLAILYFEKAYKIAKKSKDYSQKNIVAENMAIVEENRKHFQKSISYIKESQKWKDSFNDQNKIWTVAETEKKFAIKQKQKEIRLLEIQNKLKISQRNNFIYISVLLSLLFGTSIYFYFQKIKTNNIIISQKEVLNELNETKDKLFSIISHDLRSSVNSLKSSNGKLLGYLETKNYNDLDSLLHSNSNIANSTYNLLDNLLNWAQLQTNQIFFEKESLHLYSIVQQVIYNYKPLLFDKKIDLEETIPKDIFLYMDLESFKIILRNILDNALKFCEINGLIRIYTKSYNSGFTNLIIEDNGIGMSTSLVQELLKDTILLSKKQNKEIIGTGLGLQLCKTMLLKNGGKFDIETQLEIGTKIMLILPEYITNEHI